MDDAGVSEVLGNVILIAVTVSMLGAFGGVVLSTVMSDTPTPPAASFTLEPETGATSVDVRLVSGSNLDLARTQIILQVNNTARTGISYVTNAATLGRWAPGETLRVNATGAALGSTDRLLFMAIDTDTGKSIGVGYATVPGTLTGAAVHQNALVATLSFDRSPLTADGATAVNASVAVTSSMGLVLVDSVVLNLSTLGGEGALALHDDGVAPDSVAGDGQFTARFAVSNYTFLASPGYANETATVNVRDVLGHTTQASAQLYVTSAPTSKVGAGVVYRNIGSSGIVGPAGYVNLTAFTFRDASALDNDQVELRVSDLGDAAKVWSALVSFTNTGCGGPSVTSVTLSRDGVAGSVTYTPAGGCFAIDADARLNLANVTTSVDASGSTTTWTPAGTEATYQYAVAGIGSSNEALIAFFGDGTSNSPTARGLGQSDFTWAPPADALPATAPGAATDLTATPGNAYVDLAWSAPNDGGNPITAYRIYRDGAFLAQIGTNTSFRANGLTNGQLYSFEVKAVNAVGEGAASNAATATPATTPGAPSGLAATKGNTSVSLSWTAASSGGSAITSYHIYRGTSSGATTWIASSGGANTSFVANGLTNGVAYFFNVTAANALGQGASSAEASATPSTIPHPPLLGATAGNNRVTLSWTPGNDGGLALTDHRIYRGLLPGVTTLLASTGSGANTSFIDLTALNGVTYYYDVTAVNANGASATSNEASATPTSMSAVPSAPQTLSASRANNSVVLSWGAPATDGGSAIIDYKIYMGTASGAATYLASTGGANTTFTVNGLTNGQQYFFNTTAVNAIGEGDSSAQTSATPAGVPYPPTSLVATRGNQSATLTWSAPSNTGGAPITNYHVYRGASSGGTTWIASTGGANTSFVMNGLTNGVTYFFNVTAASAAGQSAGSNEATVAPATIPEPPANPAALAGDQSVTLTWTIPANGGSAITDFKIYRGTSSGAATFLAATGSGSNTSFVVHGLSNGQAYFFNVTAVNGVGESATSAEATATPAGLPSAPQSIAATKGNASVSLSWSAPASNGGSPVTSYHIYRGTASGATTYLASTGGANTTFAVNGLTNGQAYFFNVTAANAIGQGATSAEASATPSTTPDPPTSLAATPDNTLVSLSWSAPSNNGGSAITSYNVYRGASSGAATFLASTGGPNTTFVAAGLTNGQTYFFNVTAVNANGQSTSSSEASTTPATTPSAPQSLVATKGNGSVSLSWSAPASNGGSPITNYHVYRGTFSGATTFLGSTGGSNTTFVAAGLTNGVAYFFNVTAANAVGQGASSSETSATPSTVPNPPSALAATPGNATVSLSWTAPASNGGSVITGYNVYRGTTSGAATFLASIGTNTSYLAAGLTNGQAYFFNVTAVNANGQSSTSSETSAMPATVPNPPATFTATAGTNQVGLAWTDGSTGGSAITNHQIWRGPSPGSQTLLATIGANASYTDAAVTGGSTYYYQIRAVNGVGASNPSVERSATPAASAPTAPTGLTATPAHNQVALNWTTPSSDGGAAITAYKIYRGTTPGGETLLATIGTNTSFTDRTALNNVTYYYTVRAVNSAGDGTLSSEASATPSSNVNINCNSFTSSAGTLPEGCVSLQFGGTLGNISETGAGGPNKEAIIDATMNVTGITGTQALEIRGQRGNAPEDLLVQAYDPSTSTYVTIVTLPSATTTQTTFSGTIDMSVYASNGVLTLRIRDNGPDSNNSSWVVDFVRLVTT